MAQQQAIEFSKTVINSQSENVSEDPLQMDEMLTLIKSAHNLGYSVKDAKAMKSLYDVISSDLYSVWYAIENEMAIFAHNVLDLIEFTGWQRPKASSDEEDEQVDMAVAS
jgi:hypothetical protein